MKYDIKSVRGITLVALVITVVVMLILAGVAISAIVGGEGLFSKVGSAKNIYENAAESEKEQIESLLNDINNYIGKKEVEVNVPKTSEGMIPVKYDETKGIWVKADISNKNNDWYSYSPQDKKWANIVTVKENGSNTREYYINSSVGTEIDMDDILTFFVWIPRYAYSITNGYREVMDESTPETTGKIDIKFLVGNTNKDKDGNSYPTDYDATELNEGDVTPMIVHPAFTFGDEELTGIWVAKFEASGVNDITKTDVGIAENWDNYVGNRNGTSDVPVAEATSNTILTVKPSVPSWRDITTGDAQYFSMEMSKSNNVYGLNNVDSHLIKNIEWGAVAYLCYSNYGVIPRENGCYNNTSYGNYNFVTGAGYSLEDNVYRYQYEIDTFITEHSYLTSNGKAASTTGNIYGIYDFSGGSWERTAAYLNNQNENLELYGNPTINTNIKYFSNGKLNNEYTKYYDKYEVGTEEYNNQIIVEEEILTQEELWNKEGSLKYNTARASLASEAANRLHNIKGDGLYEMMNGYTFYGRYPNKENYAYFITPESSLIVNVGERYYNWKYNIFQMSTMYRCFGVRSGMAYDTFNTFGVFTASFFTGETSASDSFRPTLIL